MLFQVSADGLGELPLRQYVDHVGSNAFDHRILLLSRLTVVVRRQEILHQFRLNGKQGQGPEGAEAPLVVRLVDAVQEKNDLHGALYELKHRQLGSAGLSAAEAALIIILSGLGHQEQVPRQLLPAYVLRKGRQPAPDLCHLAEIVEEQDPVYRLSQRLFRRPEPLFEA